MRALRTFIMSNIESMVSPKLAWGCLKWPGISRVPGFSSKCVFSVALYCFPLQSDQKSPKTLEQSKMKNTTFFNTFKKIWHYRTDGPTHLLLNLTSNIFDSAYLQDVAVPVALFSRISSSSWTSLTSALRALRNSSLLFAATLSRSNSCCVSISSKHLYSWSPKEEKGEGNIVHFVPMMNRRQLSQMHSYLLREIG